MTQQWDNNSHPPILAVVNLFPLIVRLSCFMLALADYVRAHLAKDVESLQVFDITDVLTLGGVQKMSVMLVVLLFQLDKSIVAVVLLEVHPFSVFAYGNVAKMGRYSYTDSYCKGRKLCSMFISSKESFATNILLTNDGKIKLMTLSNGNLTC
ncbi:hypothetical protein I3760_15G005300 [Carya illinoinensis]|uniref:Uncharacterized protein n=1 Tax=Carya illinoinensis TaxID=32201 RepID=A0A922A2L2_CARIL|nr:hypothetical protein I3760_15G005300 [Carya illinoinensis]KAG6673714.1 hypothetical protein I3842_15G005400 [Carya illinoinensis]